MIVPYLLKALEATAQNSKGFWGECQGNKREHEGIEKESLLKDLE